MSVDDYIIREARPEEHSVIVTLLLQHFLPRADLITMYIRENEHKIDEAERAVMFEDMKNRYSALVARCFGYVAIYKPSQDIVGIILMSIDDNPKFHKDNEKKESAYFLSLVPGKSKVYTDFVNDVLIPLDQDVDLFTKFPKHQASLELTMMCVHSQHSGQGLATRLTHETVKYAERKGIKLIHGTFASPYSRKAAEKNGFQTFSDIDILSLRDNAGNSVYKNGESHVVSMMAKLI